MEHDLFLTVRIMGALAIVSFIFYWLNKDNE